MTAVVRNTGNAPLLVNGASISGPQAGDFAIVQSACTGTTLLPNATCAIDLQFTPTATSVRNASLDIASAAGAKSLSLSGLGSAAAEPNTTIIQQVIGGAGAGAGGANAGSGGGAAATPGSTLVLRRLGMAKRVKRATARRSGIRLRMDVPEGTDLLKINIYRRGGGRLTLISSVLKVPGKSGDYRVNQNAPALRKALSRLGTYEVHVTPGRSRTDLGTTSKFAFKVV
jgi:hypothetical protein